MYNRELRPTGLELTQFTLLMTLQICGETTQGKLGRLLALDSTSLTRMLRWLAKRGWISEKQGVDRRQKLLRLSASGKQTLEKAWPYWENAQAHLRQRVGEETWGQMGTWLVKVLEASMAA
jgi:DNA-binding MarR family transcriptional regulator